MNSEIAVISAEVNWANLLYFLLALAIVALVIAFLVQGIRLFTLRIQEVKQNMPEHPSEARKS